MTRASANGPSPINDVEIGQEAETIATRIEAQNSCVLGEPAAAVASPSKAVADRRWRRKNDITTSHGLAREHARLIAAMHNGRISLDAGDILSRAYGRQRELVATNELKESVAQLAQQLADLKNGDRVVSDQFPRDSSQ